MAWELKNDRPIYLQIVDIITMRIVSGFYKAGEKLPSVREFAAEAEVNPNTMQKAFAELERGGLVTTMRTSGRVVTEDESLIRGAKETIARDEAHQFLDRLRRIGYEPGQAVAFVALVAKEPAGNLSEKTAIPGTRTQAAAAAATTAQISKEENEE